MRFVVTSDTHMRSVAIPNGDVLVHCGDLTFRGNFYEIADALDILRSDLVGTSFSHMILCPGNHDRLFEENPGHAKYLAENFGWKTLINESIEIEGIKIYSSPIQPIFHSWAFNKDDRYRSAFWDVAPDCDILVTHSPALGLKDELQEGGNAGCQYIRKYIEEVKPKYALSGHLHHAYGQIQHGPTTIINAACCDDNYNAVNAPIIFEYK